MAGDKRLSFQPLETENPFEYIDRVAHIDGSNVHAVKALMSFYSLSLGEARIIYTCCPKFQETFCRDRILKSKSRGGSEYGSRSFLQRRFELGEEELDLIMSDFWNNDADTVSQEFLKLISHARIAKAQLIKEAQVELDRLMLKYGVASS